MELEMRRRRDKYRPEDPDELGRHQLGPQLPHLRHVPQKTQHVAVQLLLFRELLPTSQHPITGPLSSRSPKEGDAALLHLNGSAHTPRHGTRPRTGSVGELGMEGQLLGTDGRHSRSLWQWKPSPQETWVRGQNQWARPQRGRIVAKLSVGGILRGCGLQGRGRKVVLGS